MFRIVGEDFDVNAFLAEADLKDSVGSGVYVHRKGDLKRKTRTERRTLGYNSCSISCSEKSFESLSAQISDAMLFFEEGDYLLKILTTYQTEQLRFDFGVLVKQPTTAYFPSNFVEKCGKGNIGIELSQYPTAAKKRDRGRMRSRILWKKQ